jgi:hypothetical protein
MRSVDGMLYNTSRAIDGMCNEIILEVTLLG